MAAKNWMMLQLLTVATWSLLASPALLAEPVLTIETVGAEVTAADCGPQGLMAVARWWEDEGGSRITVYRGASVIQEIELRDSRVGGIRLIDAGSGSPERLWIGGAASGSTFRRVIALNEGNVGSVVFDEDRLGIDFEYEGAEASLSRDGTLWVVSWFWDDQVKLAVGRLEETDPFFTWDSRELGLAAPEGLGDLASYQVLNSDPEELEIALLWNGALMLVDASGGTRPVPGSEGTTIYNIHFQEDTGVLWASLGVEGLVGYPLQDGPAAAPILFDPAEAGMGARAGYVSLPGGRVLMETRGEGEERRLYTFKVHKGGITEPRLVTSRSARMRLERGGCVLVDGPAGEASGRPERVEILRIE